MKTLTFAELHAEVAAFHAAEAARHTPAAIACAAIDTLQSALADCSAAARHDVLDLLKEELYELPVTA
jgi:hypothetical protein